MKGVICLLAASILFAALPIYPLENGDQRDVLFQTSTIGSLFEGVYDGQMTYGELKQHGDFGLGTFNALDGEMIGLDGEFYQIKSDGIAHPVDGSMKTPFAAGTFFEVDASDELDGKNYTQLRRYLDDLLPTKTIFYAIKIEGSFECVLTRSVPKQEKPYSPFSEVEEMQQTFELQDVKGTMVGFWCPSFMEGINSPGYHLHFITEDRETGGHLIECQAQNVTIEIDYTSEFHMVLSG